MTPKHLPVFLLLLFACSSEQRAKKQDADTTTFSKQPETTEEFSTWIDPKQLVTDWEENKLKGKVKSLITFYKSDTSTITVYNEKEKLFCLKTWCITLSTIRSAITATTPWDVCLESLRTRKVDYLNG
ncbi:MAG TPA: hypothetical protein VD905_02865 [Flavobacteriales bacterium]|nr:hypothetical protein [Flavobacteriales bacterium]